MADEYKFNYLMNFKMKRCLEVGQKYVSRNEFFSSNIWTSFQEKIKCALMSVSRGYSRRRVVQNGARLVTIQILTTFGDRNLQVFLWSDLEENISGNQLLGHLNIVPATVFPISCYFWRIDIAVTV